MTVADGGRFSQECDLERQYPAVSHWRSPKTEGAEQGDKTILLATTAKASATSGWLPTVDHRMKTCLPAPRLPGTWNENARRANTGESNLWRRWERTGQG